MAATTKNGLMANKANLLPDKKVTEPKERIATAKKMALVHLRSFAKFVFGNSIQMSSYYHFD